MRKLLAGLFLALTAIVACGAAPLPEELVGVWSTAGAEFRGSALLKGQALYLADDGMGASIGGDGSAVIGVKMAVAGFDPGTGTLKIDIYDGGRIVAHGKLRYDPNDRSIRDESKKPIKYLRRDISITPALRKAIGF
jgi:hypothetical protein